jgi:hypothetical protein
MMSTFLEAHFRYLSTCPNPPTYLAPYHDTDCSDLRNLNEASIRFDQVREGGAGVDRSLASLGS